MKKLFLLFAVVCCTSVCANAQLKAIPFNPGGSEWIYDYTTFDIYEGSSIWPVSVLKAGHTYTIRFYTTVPQRVVQYWIVRVGLYNTSYFYGPVNEIVFKLPSSSTPYVFSPYVRTNSTTFEKTYTVQP